LFYPAVNGITDTGHQAFPDLLPLIMNTHNGFAIMLKIIPLQELPALERPAILS